MKLKLALVLLPIHLGTIAGCSRSTDSTEKSTQEDDANTVNVEDPFAQSDDVVAEDTSASEGMEEYSWSRRNQRL